MVGRPQQVEDAGGQVAGEHLLVTDLGTQLPKTQLKRAEAKGCRQKRNGLSCCQVSGFAMSDCYGFEVSFPALALPTSQGRTTLSAC